MTIYVTADEHFDNKGVITNCNRPFKDVDEMNEALVDAHNAVVTDADDVYHLGDFAFKNPAPWLARLKGRTHHLILGNHDYRRLAAIRKAGFTSIQDILYLRWEGKRFFFSHYAHRSWRNSIHGSYHCFGHSHGAMGMWGRSGDAGVDSLHFSPRTRFAPVPLEIIVATLESRMFIDQHAREEKGKNHACDQTRSDNGATEPGSGAVESRRGG